MRGIVLFTLFISFQSVIFSAVIKVPGDYPTIQQAIDSAVAGDTVLVAPGTYLENIDFKGKAITVTSEQGAEITIIDGNQNGSVVTFQKGEETDSVLEGFYITNGLSNYCSGIYCINASSPTIRNNTLSGNNGISSITISCEGSCSPDIMNNIISGNEGTGILCDGSSSPIIRNNTISGNSGNHHNGIFCNSSSPYISNNIISECTGHGIFCWHQSFPIISNNIITKNQKNGIYFWDSSALTMTNNTISGNHDHGIYFRTSHALTIMNTIIWGNQGKGIYVSQGGPLPKVTYCNIQGVKLPGEGNICFPPRFVDPDNGDFHLTYNSPCRDTGKHMAGSVGGIHYYPLNYPSTDFEGDPRIAYGKVDMGADEFYTHLYFTGDATPGGNVEVKIIDIPNTAPVVLWAGSGVLDPPMQTMYGDWYLKLPVVTTLILGLIPWDGVLHHPRSIPLVYPCWDIPIQAIVGNQLTNLSVMEVK